MARKLRLEYPGGVLPRDQPRQLSGGRVPDPGSPGGVRVMPVRRVREIGLAVARFRDHAQSLPLGDGDAAGQSGGRDAAVAGDLRQPV